MPVEVFARTPGQNHKIEQRIIVAVEVIILKVWGDRLLLLAILSAGKWQWLDRFQRNMRTHVGIPPSATSGLRDIGEQLYFDFLKRYGGTEASARRELDLEVEAGELNAAARRKKRAAILDGWQSLSTGQRRAS